MKEALTILGYVWAAVLIAFAVVWIGLYTIGRWRRFKSRMREEGRRTVQITVIGYSEMYNSHQCMVDGRKLFVDLLLDGPLSEEFKALPDESAPRVTFINNLNGQVLEVNHLDPFVSIGEGVRRV